MTSDGSALLSLPHTYQYKIDGIEWAHYGSLDFFLNEMEENAYA